MSQRGMWAMIATSIALAIWTAVLSYTTAKSERQRTAELVTSQREKEDDRPSSQNV